MKGSRKKKNTRRGRREKEREGGVARKRYSGRGFIIDEDW